MEEWGTNAATPRTKNTLSGKVRRALDRWAEANTELLATKPDRECAEVAQAHLRVELADESLIVTSGNIAGQRDELGVGKTSRRPKVPLAQVDAATIDKVAELERRIEALERRNGDLDDTARKLLALSAP